MGSGYSSAQRLEFKHYQTLMNKAIVDLDSYDNYRSVREELQKALQSGQP